MRLYAKYRLKKKRFCNCPSCSPRPGDYVTSIIHVLESILAYRMDRNAHERPWTPEMLTLLELLSRQKEFLMANGAPKSVVDQIERLERSAEGK